MADKWLNSIPASNPASDHCIPIPCCLHSHQDMGWEPCTSPGAPGPAERVSAQRGWMVRVTEALSCCVVQWWERLCSLLHLKTGWVSWQSPQAEGKSASIYIPLCAPFWTGFWVPKQTMIFVSKCESAPSTGQALMPAPLS